MFVEKTRFAVEKLVREAKTGKTKEGSVIFQSVRDKRKPRLTREESPYRELSRSKRDQFKRNAVGRKELAGEGGKAGPFKRTEREDRGRNLKSKSKEKHEAAEKSPPKSAQQYASTKEEEKQPVEAATAQKEEDLPKPE